VKVEARFDWLITALRWLAACCGSKTDQSERQISGNLHLPAVWSGAGLSSGHPDHQDRIKQGYHCFFTLIMGSADLFFAR